jgi:hypothetical protein
LHLFLAPTRFDYAQVSRRVDLGRSGLDERRNERLAESAIRTRDESNTSLDLHDTFSLQAPAEAERSTFFRVCSAGLGAPLPVAIKLFKLPRMYELHALEQAP